MVEERYNIKPSKMEGVERKFNKGMDVLDQIGREVDAGRRIAGSIYDRYDAGLANFNDFLWGPGAGKHAGSRRQSADRDDNRDDRRHGLYDEPSPPPDSNPRRNRGSQARGSKRSSSGRGREFPVLMLSEDDIAAVLEKMGIHPDSVPAQFYEDVASEFGRQVKMGIAPYLDDRIEQIAKVVDNEYTRNHGRKR